MSDFKIVDLKNAEEGSKEAALAKAIGDGKHVVIGDTLYHNYGYDGGKRKRRKAKKSRRKSRKGRKSRRKAAKKSRKTRRRRRRR